jgi:hypothetical protein
MAEGNPTGPEEAKPHFARPREPGNTGRKVRRRRRDLAAVGKSKKVRSAY